MLELRPDFVSILARSLLRSPKIQALLGNPGQWDLLAPPHARSPFVTLAGTPAGAREPLPHYVVKVLMVLPEEKEAHEGWKFQLDQEYQRLLEEFQPSNSTSEGGVSSPHRQETQDPAGQPDLGIGRVRRLRLPVRRQQPTETLPIWTARLEAIGRRTLLEGPIDPASPPLELDYLCRPYVPWPSLRELGLRWEELWSRWDRFCSEHEYPSALRDYPGMFHSFCDEALVGDDDDLFLTSGWRYELWPNS